MVSIPFSEARTHLTDIVNEVAHGGERIILTRKGKQLVAIIPLEDLRALEAIENKIDLEDAKKALRDVEKHDTGCFDEDSVGKKRRRSKNALRRRHLFIAARSAEKRYDWLRRESGPRSLKMRC